MHGSPDAASTAGGSSGHGKREHLPWARAPTEAALLSSWAQAAQ
jgi:hypothetical protein